MKQTVKLKDVAKRAGVGVGTASRVLNNHPNVSDDKRHKVLNAMDELGYHVNEIARSLKTQSSKTIAVFLMDILNPYYMRIVKGIEYSAYERGYKILLIDMDMDKSKLEDNVKEIKNKNVDGIVYMGSTVSEEELQLFTTESIPVALISTMIVGNADPYQDSFCTVNVDNKQAAFDAIEFLTKQEYTKIAVIDGLHDDLNSSIPRKNGVDKAFEVYKLDWNDSWYHFGEFKFEGGYESMMKILESEEQPEAIFAFNDEMAMGAIKAIVEKGFRIPQDFAVIGFDDLEASKFYNPGLTTIRQPRFTMGKVGSKILIDLIEGVEVEERRVIAKHSIVKRESHK